MLELRPNCEICDRDLPPDSTEARICSYECTYCAHCADNELHGVCQNCGGNLEPRPIRPSGEWRPGTGLSHHPASGKRRQSKHDAQSRNALSAKLKDVPATER